MKKKQVFSASGITGRELWQGSCYLRSKRQLTKEIFVFSNLFLRLSVITCKLDPLFVLWPAGPSLHVISFVKSQQPTKSKGGCLGRGIFLPASLSSRGMGFKYRMIDGGEALSLPSFLPYYPQLHLTLQNQPQKETGMLDSESLI